MKERATQADHITWCERAKRGETSSYGSEPRWPKTSLLESEHRVLDTSSNVSEPGSVTTSHAANEPKDRNFTKGERMIAGIDPSLTCTALVCGAGPDDYMHATFGRGSMGTSVADRTRRYEITVDEIMRCLEPLQPTHVFIEGYAFGVKQQSHIHSIAEFGGILRWHLTDMKSLAFPAAVVEVAPSTLKKFACGKGVAPKDLVCANLTQRYGVMFGSADEFEAFALYRLGRCVVGIEKSANQKQEEAVEKVRRSLPD
jgi:crossover junction endodeoxyribonuclease RuvC